MTFWKHPRIGRHLSQGWKFACVGATGAVIDFTILNVLAHRFGFDPRIANLFSTLISSIFVFLLNRRFTFRARDEQAGSQARRFAFVYGMAYVLNVTLTALFYTAGLYLLSELSTVILSNGAKALAIGVGMIWNYAWSHLFIFRKKTDAQPSAAL